MAKDRLNEKCIVIGGSAGGLKIILYILSHLEQGFATPIVIVLHRKNDSESTLSDVINNSTHLKVKEAEDKEPIMAGMVYVAPADYHLLIEKEHIFSLDVSEKINFSRPSIDVTFQTAAEAYGAQLIGIILSGANDDGTDGLKAVRKKKGTIIAQDPKTASMYVMPQSVIDHGLADHILSAKEIADFLNQIDNVSSI